MSIDDATKDDTAKGGAAGGQAESAIRFGPLGANCVHLCVDMQNLFAEQTDWHTPWLRRVLPNVEEMTRRQPERSVFTRFIPPRRVEEANGAWKRYYEHWRGVIGETLDPRLLELIPILRELAPEAAVFDKDTYSPWVKPDLDEALRRRGVDTVVVSGAETDVCVLATVLGAVDRGYRVVVPTDAICSSADSTHDALMLLYQRRYSNQIEAATTAEILESWA